MKFCEKCGNLMIATKKDGVSGYFCRKCGIFVKGKAESSTLIGEKIEQEEDTVKVVKEEDNYAQYPRTNIECPECGHNEAYWYMQQTRGADEPQTKFYSCVKCGHKWREYD
jgi:DNA-directed RNA polymerase subunit M